MSPSQLAEYAVKCKRGDDRDNDPRDRYAEIFVVVDVDEYHDHRDAQRICDEHGLRLVISNPCFEVWLIDHVRPCPPAYTRTTDVEAYAAKCNVVVGSRNKHINLRVLDGHEQDAIGNAKKHNACRLHERQRLVPHQENRYAPWTDMADVLGVLTGC